MKNIILILVMVLIASYTFAGTVPEAVQKAFNTKYPKITNVKWDKENAKEWEAEFTMSGNKLSANFMEDGTWVETEQVIPLDQLPIAVADAIKKTYPNWKIKETDKTETAKNGLIYEADLTLGSKKKGVAFKEDGTPVIE